MAFDEQGFRTAAKAKNYSDAQINSYIQSKGLAPEAKSLGGFVGNVFSSTGNLIGGVASAVAHPIKTGKAIGSIALGGVEKLIPGRQAHETSAESVASFFKERYGSMEKLGNTLYKDPVGVLADISTLAGGAGLALKGTALASKAAKVGQVSAVRTMASDVAGVSKIGRAAEALKTVSRATDPILQSVRGAGAAVKFATAGRIIAPFAEGFHPEVEALSQKYGVELPASSKTSSNVVKLVESATAKGLFGQKLIDLVESAGQKLNQIADEAVKKIGGTTDLSEAGKIVQKGFQAFRENYIATKNALYAKANLGGTKIPVDTPKTVSFLEGIIKKKEAAAKVMGKDPTDLAFFEGLRQGLSGTIRSQYGNVKTGAKATANEIKATLDEINAKIKNFNDPISTGNQATLKRIAATLEEELDAAVKASNPDLATQIDKANAYYQAGIQKLDSSYGNKITQFARQPDKIVNAIVNGKASVEDIPKIYEVVGPEAKTAIQTSVFETIIKEARGGSGEFTQFGLANVIKRYGLQKLNAIFSPEQVKVLQDLDKLSQALARGKAVALGSQTAFIGRIMGQVATFFAVSPLAAAKLVLGDYLISKFIASDVGQRFLTSGIQLTGKTGEKIQKAGEVGRVATPVSRVVETQETSTKEKK